MFLIRPCYSLDLEEVDRLLKEVYYPEEPLTKANGLEADMHGLTKSVIPQGHSVVAISENGRVVGVALNDEPPQRFPYIYTTTKEDVKFQKMFNYMENESGVLKEAPDALEVRMMAVHPDWRHLGVATSLLSATRTSAMKAGYRHLKLYCTSAYSSRLMSKLSWKLLYSLPYRRYVEEHPCDMILPPEPHVSCDLFIDEVSGCAAVGATEQLTTSKAVTINDSVLSSSMIFQI